MIGGKAEFSWKKTSLVLAIVLFLLSTYWFLRPSILGYSIYNRVKESNYSVEDYAVNVREINQQLALTQTNATLQAEFNEKLLQQTKEYVTDLTICLADKMGLSAKLNYSQESCQQKQEELQEKLKEKKEEYAARLAEKNKETEQAKLSCQQQTEQQSLEMQWQQQNHTAFVQVIARRICCKEKVDNPRISAYKEVDGALLCLESGENQLDCFSQMGALSYK